VLLVAAIILALPIVRRRLVMFAQHLAASVRKFRLSQIVRAVLLAALITIISTVILYCAARSLAIHLSLLQTFIVFSLAMLASTATPTPGGLVEQRLVCSLALWRMVLRRLRRGRGRAALPAGHLLAAAYSWCRGATLGPK